MCTIRSIVSSARLAKAIAKIFVTRWRLPTPRVAGRIAQRITAPRYSTILRRIWRYAKMNLPAALSNKRVVHMKMPQPRCRLPFRVCSRYAAWADKYEGTVHRPPLRGVVLAMKEAIGVIGIACPDEQPLLGFISLVAPAIAMGNTIVIIPSEQAPLSATDCYQVFETSDLPAGVVNIVTGERDALAQVLGDHDDVDAMWYFGTAEGSQRVEMASAGNMKRTWVNYGHAATGLTRTG